MADAIISYHNGDISSAQFAKTMLIYAIIQPILYASSGFIVKQAFKEIGGLIFGERDDEEVAKDLFLIIMNQIVVSPVNAIPILDDIALFAIRKATGQKAWRVMNTPLLDDLATGIQKLGKKKITGKDYLKASASVLEPITALPINTFIRLFGYTQPKKGAKKGAGKLF